MLHFTDPNTSLICRPPGPRFLDWRGSTVSGRRPKIKLYGLIYQCEPYVILTLTLICINVLIFPLLSSTPWLQLDIQHPPPDHRAPARWAGRPCPLHPFASAASLRPSSLQLSRDDENPSRSTRWTPDPVVVQTFSSWH